MPNSCGWEVDTYLGDRFKKKHEGDKLAPLSTLQDCKDGKRLLTNFADFPPMERIKATTAHAGACPELVEGSSAALSQRLQRRGRRWELR